jgi:nucleotide-binding universal stress UspA family protein
MLTFNGHPAHRRGHPAPAKALDILGQDQRSLHWASDLTVMASHRRHSLARPLIGSQANRVVTLSPVPVLVCR